MTFTDNFKGCDTRTIADGAMIQCEINGIYYAATIHRDDDSGPPWANDRDIAEYLETDSFHAQYKRVTPEPTDGQG